MSFYCLTDSDQNNWLDDPELFLYAKGPDDVHLWRCKKPASSSSSSSLVVPMKSDDFDYVSYVKNHEELIGYLFNWDETDYNRLVKYIYEKRLLVNSQGFVIAELLHKADKDANKTINDANEEDVPAIYIRSLDVLRLKPYIPDLTEPPIPLRMVKYLGDVDGKAAMMEEKDSNVITKLTARVDDLESKNETLGINITKLTADQVAMTDKGNDLESKNKILDINVTKLTAGQVDLKSENKTLEGKVTKLTADLVTQMNALAILRQELDQVKNGKEVWMNDFTNSDWVSFGAITFDQTAYNECKIIKPRGTFTVDDRSTNVRAIYWCSVRVRPWDKFTNTAVCLEELTLKKEKARFSPTQWRWYIKHQGKTYVLAVQIYD